MSGPSVAILWFRRDLRLHDQPALRHALDAFDRVVPLFVVDPAILTGRWPSPNRWWFLARSLEALDQELRERGSRLHVVRGDPAAVVPAVAASAGARAVVASRDYTPFGRRRDEAVATALSSRGLEWRAGRGVLAHEPEDVRRDDGGPFRVFSPFHRRWVARELRPVLPAPRSVPTHDVELENASAADDLLGHPLPTADLDHLLEPGEAAARQRLDRWGGSRALGEYATARDRLDLDGTSRLSQDLRWGLLSPVEVLARCAGDGTGPTRFRTEIAWREFYAHLLWHEPRIATESFRGGLDHVWVPGDGADVEAWQAGRTGYPIVDAAMRQLLATGWMHNRARMIVASFLTKHLLVDWRVGESHFMRHLVDGDPASNNGGWQWAASTGTDPQPWFRIFNPTLQARRHDPDGAYVRRWLPDAASSLPPIVDHATARQRALDAFSRSPDEDEPRASDRRR
jgi:deoxyribodipyrimidine photo-lyase